MFRNRIHYKKGNLKEKINRLKILLFELNLLGIKEINIIVLKKEKELYKQLIQKFVTNNKIIDQNFLFLIFKDIGDLYLKAANELQNISLNSRLKLYTDSAIFYEYCLNMRKHYKNEKYFMQ